MTREPLITRRTFAALLAGALAPLPARAGDAREIMWDDLIPPGLPYSEIIGEGEMDEQRDIWKPVFDEYGVMLNKDLNGARIRMPGYIVPLESGQDGVTLFLLVPYAGACIHTPPPPPNQLVLVTTPTPWPGTDPLEAVWVTGTLHGNIKDTDIAQSGYTMTADEIEVFTW